MEYNVSFWLIVEHKVACKEKTQLQICIEAQYLSQDTSLHSTSACN